MNFNYLRINKRTCVTELSSYEVKQGAETDQKSLYTDCKSLKKLAVKT